MTMTKAEQDEFLAGLELDTEGETLAGVVGSITTSAPKATIQPAKMGVRWAPEGVDPHTMPVGDIVFTDEMVESVPDLSGDNFQVASRILWVAYKSPRGQSERNQLLHRRITEFLHGVNRHRKTGGVVRDLIKTSAADRDNGRLLAAAGVTTEHLATFIKALKEAQNP